MKKPKIIFTRELFIETMAQLQKQRDHDKKCSDAFSIILPDDFVTGYDNTFIHSQFLKLLKTAFKDDHQDSWIEYFMWDLDFGRKYEDGCATYKNGSNIIISDSGLLWDFLVSL